VSPTPGVGRSEARYPDPRVPVLAHPDCLVVRPVADAPYLPVQPGGRTGKSRRI